MAASARRISASSVVAVGRAERHADAAGHGEAERIDVERPRHRIDHAARGGFGGQAASAWCTSSTNSSLPRRATVSTLRRQDSDALGHFQQHAVAEAEAQGVVDVLEAVEVEHHQRERLAVALVAMASANSTRSASSGGWAGRSARRSGTTPRCAALAASFSLMSRNENTRPIGWPRLHCGSVTRSITLPVCSVKTSVVCSSAASWMAQAALVVVGVDHAAPHPACMAASSRCVQQRLPAGSTARRSAG
jgi:hypothetical protein